jgi:two-component system, chemotaxis family, protein-glutamate methylesterase/glutaminase
VDINNTRIIVVDSSAVIRRLLCMMLATEPSFKVIATAADPFEARDKIVQLHPDVMILDLNMPRMDGLTFLQKVMTHMPLRTLVVSNLPDDQHISAERVIKQWGFEIIKKPMVKIGRPLPEQSKTLIGKIKRLARRDLRGDGLVNVRHTVKHLAPQPAVVTNKLLQNKIIVIAASTGGTEALKKLFTTLPADMPSILIVQHMPKGFTSRFAASLNQVTKLSVKEAVDGEGLIPGTALICPGDYHLEVKRRGKNYYTYLHQEEIRFGLRPAADYLFRSVASFGESVLGVIMTGMGKDGAKAMKMMRDKGCKTVGQSEKSCVVFGMSKVAIELGGVDVVGDLSAISAEMIKFKESS